MDIFELFDKCCVIFSRGNCLIYLLPTSFHIIRIIKQKKDYSDFSNSFGESDFFVMMFILYILSVYGFTGKTPILSMICVLLFVVYLFCIGVYTKKYRVFTFILILFISIIMILFYIWSWNYHASHETASMQAIFHNFVSK